MSFTVYYSNPEITSRAGFGKVAHLPCIFDNRPGYHRTSSAYLIDRGLGLWDPHTRGKMHRPALTNQTIKNYAHWLANFLEWAEIRNINLNDCSYAEHIRGRYQEEMITGIWSRDGIGLKASTVNLRVQQACEFLTWMCDKGYRHSFHIPMHTATISSGKPTSYLGQITKKVQVREGKVRKNKKALRLPSDDEIKKWLEQVYSKQGFAQGLMCELILLSALRRSEAAAFRIDTLPLEPSDWHLSDPSAPRENLKVRIEIRYGTKGPCYGYDHDDKIGPCRDIWIPISLAEKIHTYRQRIRNTALKKWIKSTKSVKEQIFRINNTVHLFLDEKAGERITSKQLYYAWTNVSLPFKGWSPHLGRDYWACSTLEKEVDKHEKLKKLLISGSAIAEELLDTTAVGVIRLHIQPQLGHASATTSLIYLEWISRKYTSNLSIQLDEEDESN